MKRFSELPTETPVKDTAYFLKQVRHNVNHGYFVDLRTMQEMRQQPNHAELLKEVFAVINEKNSVVNERYTSDFDDTHDTLDIIEVK